MPFVIDFAKRLGMNAQYNMDLSISLGSAATSLMELTKTYAVFPRLGRKVTPRFIMGVKDRDGNVIEEMKAEPPVEARQGSVQPAPVAMVSGRPVPALPTYPLENDSEQVMDPRVAYVMTHLMKEVVMYGTGHGAKSLGRAAAGKTGTTNDYLDAWFIGFTPQVVTGVWVGFDGQTPIGPSETGARAALPVWLSFMQEAVKNYPDTDFTIPPGIVFVSVDPTTGKRLPPDASNSIKEAFIEGTEPTQMSGPGTTAAPSQSDFLKEDID